MNTVTPSSPVPSRVKASRGLLALAIALTSPCWPAEAPSSSPKIVVEFLVSSSLFRTVSKVDATAALRVWGNMVAEQRGLPLEPKVIVFDDIVAARKRISTSSNLVLAVDAAEYFKISESPGLEPVLMPCRSSAGELQSYVLVVRSASGPSNLEGLRGKSILIQSYTGANVGRLWLESLLFDGRLGRLNKFFASSDTVDKATAALLPVFFGKVDAAIVDEGGFAVTKEMNPQVGAQLRIIARSQGLSDGFLFVAPRTERRDDIVSALRDLQTQPQGRQILTVFRMGRLIPLNKGALDYVREIWRKHTLLNRPVDISAADLPHGGAQ